MPSKPWHAMLVQRQCIAGTSLPQHVLKLCTKACYSLQSQMPLAREVYFEWQSEFYIPTAKERFLTRVRTCGTNAG